MRARTLSLVAVAATASAAAAAVPVSASRSATASERRAIITSVQHFLSTNASASYRDSKVTQVKVSTARRGWARVNTSSSRVGRASAFLQLTRAKGWRVRNFGQVSVQCISEAPDSVKVDLYGSAGCDFEP